MHDFQYDNLVPCETQIMLRSRHRIICCTILNLLFDTQLTRFIESYGKCKGEIYRMVTTNRENILEVISRRIFPNITLEINLRKFLICSV